VRARAARVTTSLPLPPSQHLISCYSPPVVEFQLGIRQKFVAVEEQGEGVQVDVPGLRGRREEGRT
jgi:hypothetical protein